MKKIAMLSLVLTLLTGCIVHDGYYEDTYTTNQLNRAQRLVYGRIISARPVVVEEEGARSRHGAGAGTLAGAVIGGYVGHGIGHGMGNRLATSTGIVAGALAGNAIENRRISVNGVELVIELKDGSDIVVVQKGRADRFYAGQKVRIIKDGRSVKIAPVTASYR